MAIRRQEKAAQEVGQPVQTDDTAPAQGEGQRGALPELTVRIFPVRNTNSKLKATANVNIAGAFAVQGFRIFDSKNGLFVKGPEQTYIIKEGTELSRSVFFPVTKEAREALHGQILHSYEVTMEKEQRQSQDDTDFYLNDEDAPPERTYEPPLEDEDLHFEMGQSM